MLLLLPRRRPDLLRNDLDLLLELKAFEEELLDELLDDVEADEESTLDLDFVADLGL